MSNVQVQFLSLLQVLAGEKAVALEAGEGLTVRELLHTVSRRYPRVGEYLGDLSHPDLFHHKVAVIVNQVHVASMEAVITPGAAVMLMVPFCGG